MEGLIYLQDQYGLHLKWKLWAMIARDSYLFLQGIYILAKRVSIMLYFILSIYDSFHSHIIFPLSLSNFYILDNITPYMYPVKVCCVCRRIKKVVQSTMVLRAGSIHALWSNDFTWGLWEGKLLLLIYALYSPLWDESSWCWKLQ